MLKALQKLQQNAETVKRVKKAAGAFLNTAPRRAFTTWLALRETIFAKRKSMVWLAVQRGHRVGALQEMFETLKEPALIEQLLQMMDELGMTPLLWACKKGFADIVEVLLSFSEDAHTLISACASSS